MAAILKLFAVSAGLLFTLGFWAEAGALDKVKFATVVRAPSYDMPLLAAQEKGFWAENGLELEWLAMEGPAATFQALVAGSVDLGMSDVASAMLAASQGVPLKIVTDLKTSDYWHIWVRADGPIRELKDLKGTRIVTMTMPSAPGAYGLFLLKVAGLSEKDVKLVRLRSPRERAAALRAGIIDAYVGATQSGMPLKVRGMVRSLISMKPYLPEEWPMHVLFSHIEFIGKRPEVLKRTIRVFLRATEFVQDNPEWTIRSLMSYSKYPEDAARETFKLMKYGRDGKINIKALNNVRNFLIDWGVISEEKAISLELLVNRKFTE